MNRLRSPSTLRPCGLLLGMLLAVCPILQTALTCVQQPHRTDAAAQEAIVQQIGERQWTCTDRASATSVHAVLSERPDDVFHGGVAVALENPSSRRHVQTETAPRTSSLLSPFLEALRPVVLQI